MDGLSSLILAAVLGGAPLTLHPPADLPRADAVPAVHLDVDWDPRMLAPSPSGLAFVESVVNDRMYLSPSGWFGLAVSDQLALLVDVRVDRLPTSPDPARPDPRDAFSARFGVELRPSIEVPF